MLLQLPVPQTPTENLLSLVTSAVRSPHTKRAYRDAIMRFISWYRSIQCPGFTKATVQLYRCTLEQQSLSPSSIKVRMAALRRLASKMADAGLLDPARAAAMVKVKGPTRRGVRLGNWLTLQQVERLLRLPDSATVKGKRDRALLSVLIGAGLRRAEAGALSVHHIQQREGRWVIADLIGKHERIRTIPIPGWCKVAIDQWAEAADIKDGRVFRPLNRAGRISGPALSGDAIFQIVKQYAGQMDVEIAPHDLRRTFAKLAYRGRAALEQIQFSLGHDSIVTTEAYLGVRQDLADAPCDHLGIHAETATCK